MRRLNSSGVIRGNRAVLDPDRVELPLCAFVFIDLALHPGEAGFRADIAARPEVEEIHLVAGQNRDDLRSRDDQGDVRARAPGDGNGGSRAGRTVSRIEALNQARRRALGSLVLASFGIGTGEFVIVWIDAAVAGLALVPAFLSRRASG